MNSHVPQSNLRTHLSEAPEERSSAPGDDGAAPPSDAGWERLADVLRQEQSREHLCEGVCRVLVEEFGFTRALIATLDREKERLVTRAGYDPVIGIHVARALRRLFTIPLAPESDGRLRASAWCVLRGEQIHVPDATAYEFRPDETVQRDSLVQVFGVKEYVLTPIRGRRGPIGLLAADKKGRAERIAPGDLGLLRAVASMTALAMDAGRPALPPEPARRVEPAGQRRDRTDRAAQMQAVLDALHEGLLVLDEDGVVRYLNRAASSLLAVLPWEAVGEPWRDVLHLTDPDVLAPLLAERPGGARERPARLVLESPADGCVTVDVEVLRLSSAHGSTGTALFLDDVTDDVEEERVREEFVSMLIHDLSAPVQSVLGFAELLLMGRAGSLNETQRDFVSRIAASSDLMTHLVDDILRLSDLESGRALLEREMLDPRALVQGVLDRLYGLADDAAVELLNEIPGNLPSIRADRVRLQEALQNVVSNAIEASEPRTAVRVRAELVPRGDEPWIRLEVTDEGVGLDEDVAAHLFDKYRSFRRGKHRAHRALGLGLAIARLVVEAHGGDIRAAGRPGRGTVVTVDMPLDPEIR